MLKIKKIIVLIFKYIIELLIPAFGLIALICAGNTATFILGLLITIISLGTYIKENYKKQKNRS